MTKNRAEVPVPPALVDEILKVADSPREAQNMLNRLEERLEGFADWPPPYESDPAVVAAGEQRVREYWGDRYRQICSCEVPKCGRCFEGVT